MLPTLNPDNHPAFESCQLARPRLRHHRDVLLLHAAIHARAVLQDEAPAAPAQLSCDALHCHVRARTFRPARRRPSWIRLRQFYTQLWKTREAFYAFAATSKTPPATTRMTPIPRNRS